jgi:hypothetical protein
MCTRIIHVHGLINYNYKRVRDLKTRVTKCVASRGVLRAAGGAFSRQRCSDQRRPTCTSARRGAAPRGACWRPARSRALSPDRSKRTLKCTKTTSGFAIPDTRARTRTTSTVFTILKDPYGRAHISSCRTPSQRPCAVWLCSALRSPKATWHAADDDASPSGPGSPLL